MFDIGAAELLVIVIVAILVIGPKDMPRAMRSAGRWIGKLRRMSAHFRSGIDEMVRQAEIEEMEEKWSQRNKEIMAKYPTGNEPEGGAPEELVPPRMEPLASAGETADPDPDPEPDPDAAAEAAIRRAALTKAPEHGGGEAPVDPAPKPAAKPAPKPSDEPSLPFGDAEGQR
ncbi:Sec-independent protein translocase protein TatB [Erythrobacter sp. SD-21]|uniref:Sec-independent protein translocase protein TatB n=1 Tax=Erythrobacter sp. SD-21 TaxID=161528 RepID=UPI000153EE8D|nr:Sec-independent protein translocase protein TatB [Erythrobacter sp. SD-21]EDL48706.1 Sec-independent protein secretion pathway component [Erythrobacter sp. SD-21]